MKVIFHPEAYEEMLESARFFEEKSAGLGSDLIAAIQSATRRLKKFPESGVVEQGTIRKCLVRVFHSPCYTRLIPITFILLPSCISIGNQATGPNALNNPPISDHSAAPFLKS